MSKIIYITRCHSAQLLLTQKWNYIEDGENKISLIIDVDITGGKANTMYSALSNEIEKCSRVESSNEIGIGGASIIIGYEKS